MTLAVLVAFALATPMPQAELGCTAAVPNDNTANGVSHTTTQSAPGEIATNPNQQSEKSRKLTQPPPDQRARPQLKKASAGTPLVQETQLD